MKILIYGAGVIGSFYASRLCKSHDVTLLARGRRLEELRTGGLRLVNEDTGVEESHRLPVVDRLAPDDRYDYIFVTMRCQQVLEILPALQANCSPTVVLMLNGVTSYDKWHEALSGRMLTAFPELGGEVRDGVVRYVTGIGKKGAASKTYLGAPGGRAPALRRLKQTMEACGLPVHLVRRMRDFHFMHVALVSPIANALYKCGGSNYALAADRKVLREMLLSMRECMGALAARGIRVTPAGLRQYLLTPLWLAVPAAAKMFATPHMEAVAARHARNARDEMAWLYRELMEFLGAAAAGMPATLELGKYLSNGNIPV